MGRGEGRVWVVAGVWGGTCSHLMQVKPGVSRSFATFRLERRKLNDEAPCALSKKQ